MSSVTVTFAATFRSQLVALASFISKIDNIVTTAAASDNPHNKSRSKNNADCNRERKLTFRQIAIAVIIVPRTLMIMQNMLKPVKNLSMISSALATLGH